MSAPRRPVFSDAAVNEADRGSALLRSRPLSPNAYAGA
jgi:hypothetical protein